MEVSAKKAQRILSGGAIARIEAEISSDVIHVPIAIHIGGGYGLPQARACREPEVSGRIAEPSALVQEATHGSPFLANHKVDPSIIIGIRPDRRRDDAQLLHLVR